MYYFCAINSAQKVFSLWQLYLAALDFFYYREYARLDVLNPTPCVDPPWDTCTPSSFSAGPGQAACWKCSHTAVFKAMINGPEAGDHSRTQNHTAFPEACHPFWGLTGTWQKNLEIAVPAEFLCFHCKLAVPGELLGQNCAALQSPFFGVKLRDYEAEGIIHHYWL